MKMFDAELQQFKLRGALPLPAEGPVGCIEGDGAGIATAPSVPARRYFFCMADSATPATGLPSCCW
jgi:hypothetical protein